MTKGVIVIEGHVQGLANTRMLGRMGVPVIVIDKDNCIARYSRYCSKYYRCPDYLSASFIRFLTNLARTENLQGWLLLPSNDHAVYNISKHKDALGEHYSIITEDIGVIEKIYNKRTLLEIATRISIPIPATVMPVNSNPDHIDIRYPVLVKGNNGLTFYQQYHHKAFFVQSETELHTLFSNQLSHISPTDYFIQELIPEGTNTISATVFAIKGEVYAHWMGVKLREHPLRFGTATCCQSLFNQVILDQSKVLVKELCFTGVCEIEWLQDVRDGQYKLIEINARTWLWVGLAEKCGVNYPLIIYEFVYNGSLPEQKDYEIGKYWINLYTDIFFSIMRLTKGIDAFSSILSSYHCFNEACWERLDPLPFFVYGLFILKFLKHRC